MKKKALMLAVPMTLFAIGAAGCGGQKFDEQTLKYTERDTNDFGFVDAPPKTTMGKQGPEKLSSGDIVTFRAGLVRGSAAVGDLDATCTITKGAGTFDQSRGTCLGTASLPGGTLTLAVGGKPFFGNHTTGSVVGGSGKYEGATGGFTSVGDNHSRDTFHIFVPK
jgi:hypothetical protein